MRHLSSSAKHSKLALVSVKLCLLWGGAFSEALLTLNDFQGPYGLLLFQQSHVRIKPFSTIGASIQF